MQIPLKKLKNTDTLNCAELETRIYALTKYINVRRNLCEPILKETINKIKKEKISKKELADDLRLIQSKELIKKVAEQILPQNSPNIEKMCELLKQKRFVENLSDANFSLSSKDVFPEYSYITKNYNFLTFYA